MHRVGVLPAIVRVVNVYGFMLQVVGVTYGAVELCLQLPVTCTGTNGFAFVLYIVGYPSNFATGTPAAIASNKRKIEGHAAIHLLHYLPPVNGLLHLY